MVIINDRLIYFNLQNRIIKKIVILFFFIINSIVYNATADSVISKICCSGLQRVSLDTVLFNLPIKVGIVINEDILADCIKMLFATGYFEEICISNHDGIILIVVKECPIINTIKIYKNKIIKSEIVQQILDTKQIKSGNPFNQNSINAVQQEFKNAYYNFGKLNATVQIVTIPLTRNRLDLQVIFSEGSSAKISHINIVGNRVFSQKQLLKQLTLYSQIKYKNVIFRKTYQKQKLFHDLEVLRNFYLNRGYAKFRIDDIQFNITSDKKNVSLTIYITEGSCYFFKSLIVLGNALNRMPEIKEYLQIKPKELYNNKKIEEIERKIRFVLGEFGYIQPNIFIELSFDDYNKTVIIYVYVDLGKRLYIREIRFEGNNFTQDSVIRREIQQIEQTPLNYTNILKDQKQLQRFSYIKATDACIEYITNSSNQVDLIYKIEERNTGNLNLSVGFGTESGLNMHVNISQENWLGTGNAISMTATNNRYQTYFDASILKKFFGIKKINMSSRIFYNNFIRNKIDRLNYNMKNYGFDIHHIYPCAQYQSYDIGLNYISNNLSQIAPQIAIWRYLYSIGIDPLALNKHKGLNSNINFCINDFLLVSVWTFNNLNRVYFPEFGTRISITSNITVPGSYNKYYKIMVDGNYYISLDRHSKWVLLNTIYAGYSGGLLGNKESPFYDNFYIGGIATVRGFQLHNIGPKAAYYNCTDSDTQYSTCTIQNSSDAVGGNATILVKHELTIPVIYYISNNTEYSNTARISLFIDAGTVWDTHWQDTVETRAAGIIDYSNFRYIRISSGISLKWISPIGPIVLSYSKFMKKYPGDILEPFQFSIGKSW